MAKKTRTEEQKRAITIIESGSEVAGAATGAAIGLIGGPVSVVGGAATGALFGRVLSKIGSEVSKRLLGPREEVRIGAALAFAGETITQYLAAGREPRGDGFFDSKTGNRSSADELLEGVLIKARDAYEEKKLRLLGTLYANIAFHKEITPAQANHMISLAGQLTYRQLIGIAFAREQGVSGPVLREGDFRNDQEAKDRLGLNGVSLVTELYELYQRGLIHDANGSAWISVGDVNPGGMRTQGAGAVLAQLMGLHSIPLVDRQEFFEVFSKD